MPGPVRILLLADSHLGFDLPNRPRATRRRRGHDFLDNYAVALRPAMTGAVDIVVHCGDVFDRPQVPPSLAYQALEPLARIADRGIPVIVVPGNHERSRLPHPRFAEHPLVHVFDRPRTFTLDIAGVAVAVAGFPFERRDVRQRFPQLLARTEWERSTASLRLLCVHHCVEGATVGPGDFMFKGAPDVIRLKDVPNEFAAVLSGHIHRHQVLTRDLHGRRLSVPVLYPGSLERTSLAEMGEDKGYMLLRLSGPGSAPQLDWEFRQLPARPMLAHEIAGGGLPTDVLDAAVQAVVRQAPANAVLRIRVTGDLTAADPRVLSKAHVRRYASPLQEIEIRTDAFTYMPRRKGRGRADPSPNAAVSPVLELEL